LIARSGGTNGTAGLNEAFAALRVCADTVPKSGSLTFVRHATHKAQGAVNKAKDGPGKRLGAKKSGGMFCPPSQSIPCATGRPSSTRSTRVLVSGLDTES
jgi:hypothetical protein